MGKYWVGTGKNRHQTEEGYKHSYEKWHGTSKYKSERSARNSARRAAEKSGRVHKGDGADLHHSHGIRSDKTVKLSASTNRAVHEKSRRKGSKRNTARWGK